MGKTFVQPGKVLEHANSSGSPIAAGDVVVIGDTVALALVDIPDGESGSISVAGVHKVPKTAGNAWGQGDKIAWDASAGSFTAVLGVPAAGDVDNAGVAARDAASADAEAELLLTPGTGTVT